jgi:hypothetical protein
VRRKVDGRGNRRKSFLCADLPQAEVAQNEENYDNHTDDVENVAWHITLLANKSSPLMKNASSS